LRTTEVLDNLNELLGPAIFPPRADGLDPRTCPACNQGQLSLKVGKFGAFVGCSNYPECRFTRTLSATGDGEGGAEGDKPGQRALGTDPATGQEVTVRDGRFGAYIQLGEGEKPKRSSLPKGVTMATLTLPQALALLALPREVAKHPTSGEPILAGIGRYGPYVQHGKTYANLGNDDDVLEIGGNRAIDLIVGKETGTGERRGRGAAPAGRAIGDHPEGGAVTVRDGRFGPYVNWGKVNATLPKGTTPDTVTLDEALRLIEARAAAAPSGRSASKSRGTSKAKPAAKAAAKPKAAAKTSAKAPAKAATPKAAAKPAAKARKSS
ncbi:MAG: topoisomerase DNA-binding C4 zinc finger domain-containing protein, partial [Caulobacteraceae bacterium]|nr:topoisomerase DNA-binding C4 zinc finger domain-containing protein [Caulobacter sp.]